MVVSGTVIFSKIIVVRGPPFNLRGGGEGGGWSFFLIKNFGRILREITNLFQELLYINM